MKEELKDIIKKVTDIVINQNLDYKTVVKNLQNHMSKGLAMDIAGIACKRAEYFNSNKGKCVNLNYMLD
jgi:hypothetical protein